MQRELSEGLNKEEAAFKQTLLTTIRAAALARNQYWTAAAWLLERKYPDEYGKVERQRDDRGRDEVPKIVLGVVSQPVALLRKALLGRALLGRAGRRDLRCGRGDPEVP